MRTGMFIMMVLMSTALWGHEPVVKVELDSVAIEVVAPGQTYIIHEVLPKQTLYTIAKAYGIKVEHLYRANTELRERLVKMHEKIRVPLIGMMIEPTIAEGPKAYYKVQPKETVYRLANQYFHMEIEHLLALNNMSQPRLEIGQKLLIGTLTPRLVDDLILEEEVEEELFSEASEGLTWKEDKSVAFWHKNEEGSEALFVLHDEAPINSMVEITNPVFDRTILAKVIGRIPEGAYTRDIDVILSNGVAQQLGAIDPRLYVKMKYLK